MRLSILIAVTLLLITACSIGEPASTPIPTVPPLTGNVDIEYPQDGTVIYSELMHLSGTAQNLSQFTLKLVNVDDTVIAQAEIQVGDDGNWQLELVHGYNGEPTEVTILALPSPEDERDYDIAIVMMAASSHRPDGTFGSIFTPFEGDTVSGDTIEVMGTASGLFEGDFILELVGSDGQVIESQIILVYGFSRLDELPWAANLATNSYTGPAQIRAYTISPRDGAENLLNSVSIIISATAG